MKVIEHLGLAEKALIKEQIQNADEVLVGLGAGMALSAGLKPLPLDQRQSKENYWHFWRPYLEEQRFQQESNPVYDDLMTLLAGKDYFIIDANPDGMLYRSGVDLDRLYKVQGDLARAQCQKNCSHKVYPVRHSLQKLEQGKEKEICCPECGAPLVLNVYTDKDFCEAPYEKQKAAYFRFINSSDKERLVILEIGVGYTIPEMMRFPFEYIVQNHRNASLIRVNTLHPLCVEENKHKAICIACDAGTVLKTLVE